jgi:N-acetylglutamate synthase-like GNAT family acetyltransferase
MYHGSVRIRRGRRTDVPALMGLLAATDHLTATKAQMRHWRRLASDPRHDFYVAEQAGAIRGMLLVCYVRELRKQGWQAILDMVTSASPECTLDQELLAFAKMRARKRGCQHLMVWLTDRAGDEQLAAFTRAGFQRSGAVLSCGLA